MVWKWGVWMRVLLFVSEVRVLGVEDLLRVNVFSSLVQCMFVYQLRFCLVW